MKDTITNALIDALDERIKELEKENINLRGINRFLERANNIFIEEDRAAQKELKILRRKSIKI